MKIAYRLYLVILLSFIAVIALSVADYNGLQKIHGTIELFASIIVLLIIGLLTISTIQPIRMLEKIESSNSDLETKIKERTTELEKTKSRLKEIVSMRTAELEKAKSELEETVDKRTSELYSKLVELEKMNSMMVDRELRMIELKKEIEELKNQPK